MNIYGAAPQLIGEFPEIDLKEVMYYLYLPIYMPEQTHGMIQIPKNLMVIQPLIDQAIQFVDQQERPKNEYIYISARKGWATPDNPLNRPGWHSDGFGTDDINIVWWKGSGTRFALQEFKDIPPEDDKALLEFEKQIDPRFIVDSFPQGGLYAMDQTVVHATPLLTKGEMRQYVKISFSPHKYNLENNSHNYFFDYDWDMEPRELIRNNTFKAGKDFA